MSRSVTRVRWFTRERAVFVLRSRRPWFLFGIGGSAVVRRRLSGADETVSPAEHGSTPGAVLWVSDEHGRARFVSADAAVAGETVAVPSPATLGLCDDATRREALRVAVPSEMSSWAGGSMPAHATVDIGGDRACIRNVQGTLGEAFYAWPAPGGGLVGVEYDDTRHATTATDRARFRCSPVAARGLAGSAR